MRYGKASGIVLLIKKSNCIYINNSIIKIQEVITMKKSKNTTFERAFNSLQRKLIAEMLINNDVEKVKYVLCSYKVQYTDDLAVEIKAKYGKK